ncbi:glycoside hydrolase family 35 protein [Coniochaeta ligniaria NRRL 30616]|uniref:Beta-galactosidase n=1 Tax=Coniochaeta ligniaria NRRL 30616 TaxID=1408157 RepID=A0A1J7ITN9_9PEZI|nr:glycoside hydrolase family 35 protein [Coniochaeta ligniaria NRRL 30616]
MAARSIAVALLTASQNCDASALRGRPNTLLNTGSEPRALLQDIVTWDEHSLFINGERVMIFSGEFHPYRLPVPSLWTDVLEKVKALGLNAVSIYIDWAQLEGKPGEFRAEGVFDYDAFLTAAKAVGLYVIARPGPYINAEASGGGFPGWLQRVKGHLRTNDSDYLAATDNYVANIGRIIAKHQITNGGPVILYQPENEYSGAVGVEFPNADYMQYVEDQARTAGIVVPFVSNDASPGGHNAPGTGKGAVDIYGHDGYPLGFDCANPNTWPAGALPTNWHATHENQSPSTPYTIPEFQAGSFDPWGGWGWNNCYELINHEQERVFYKNNYAAGVTVFSLYMIFGGTNWGNLGHPGGYTSYDYAAPITEDRSVTREKYSELKLEAQFLQVSPGYLTATPGDKSVTGVYSPSSSVSITPIVGANGSFFVARHTDYQSIEPTTYTLNLPTSRGNITIPQLGGFLTLGRRDSKIHVVDYPVGDYTLLYSTAEIFTWKQFEDKTVLVVYGGPDEQHELAIKTSAKNWKADNGLTVATKNGGLVVNWETTSTRRILQVGDLYIYILDRNSAYNCWVPKTSSTSSLIVNGGYLIRSATVSGTTLNLKGDFNQSTSTLEIIGVAKGVSVLKVNDAVLLYTKNAQGNWQIAIPYVKPVLSIPDLAKLDWKYINSLPEIKPGYDDSKWVTADHTTTNNTFVQPFLTPTSLFASDYGFHTGALLYRGHFTAAGTEKSIYLSTQGGSAFGSSVWLNDTFLGSWTGTDASAANNDTYTLPNLVAGKPYVLTVLIDNMGLDENWVVGPDQMKNARGILNYNLAGSPAPITWKLTGNLGGEDYADKTRGPLNEGGLFIERQGYHLPNPPVKQFSSCSGGPYAGLTKPGVAFYTAQLDLALPSDTWDVPLSFVFENNTAAAGGAYRAWLYVNGFQFGRYVSNVGPQTEFPVPEGILNYKGENWIGLAVWALESGGAKVPGFTLKAGNPVITGRQKVEVVDAPGWKARQGAY